MKKALSIVLCLIICLSVLSGCGIKNEGPYDKGTMLQDAIGDNNLSIISVARPKEIIVTIDKGGDQSTVKISDEEQIEELVDIFTEIEIGKNSATPATDNYNKIEFVWESGESTVINLSLYDLEARVDDKSYFYQLDGIEEFFDKVIEISQSKGNITPTEASSVEFQKYSDSSINIDIPKGWKVSILDGVTAEYYTFKVYKPDDDRYQLFFNMKNEGYMASEKDRNLFKAYYPNSPFAKLPVLNPQSCEGFYKIFNSLSDNNTSNFRFPIINDFKIIETLGNNITGGDIVRATCTDDDHNKLDGIFTTTVKKVSLYYATTTSVYNTIFFTAPENMLIEWEPIFNKMLGSFSFTQAHIDQFYSIQDSNFKAATVRADIYSQTSDIITKGWEARQSTYDTISQKQSDATLGYERVYDVNTGDIYKAQNGFMDSYSGTELKPVTDDMYNLPIDGYIE